MDIYEVKKSIVSQNVFIYDEGEAEPSFRDLMEIYHFVEGTFDIASRLVYTENDIKGKMGFDDNKVGNLNKIIISHLNIYCAISNRVFAVDSFYKLVYKNTVNGVFRNGREK